MKKHITYIYTNKNGLDELIKWWSSLKTTEVSVKILNKTKILTKLVSDTIHDVIPTKHQKYPSTTIIKNANVLAKANK